MSRGRRLTSSLCRTSTCRAPGSVQQCIRFRRLIRIPQGALEVLDVDRNFRFGDECREANAADRGFGHGFGARPARRSAPAPPLLGGLFLGEATAGMRPASISFPCRVPAACWSLTGGAAGNPRFAFRDAAGSSNASGD